MRNWKMKIVTGLITLLLIVLAADVVAVVPNSLPWILGAFAVPGVWRFARLLYRWLTTDDDRGIVIALPRHRKKSAFAKVWAGEGERNDA